MADVQLPITLRLADVKAAGLKAYREGRLSAQGPTPACAYRDASGHPCVIGAALPDVVALDKRAEGASVFGLRRYGLIRYDEDGIDSLQQEHDDWARACMCGDEAEAAKHEARLLKLLEAA